MTRPTSFVNPFPQGVGGTGGDPSLPPGQPPVDCCADAEDMPDRALDGNTFIGVNDGDGSLVQSKEDTFNGGGATTLTFDSDPDAGNLLVAVLIHRGGGGSSDPLTGWTSVGHGGASADYEVEVWWRSAPGGSVTVTPTGVTNERRFTIMEYAGGAAGLLDVVTLVAEAASSTCTIGDVTVAVPSVLVGVITVYDAFPASFIDDPDYTEVNQGPVDGGLRPDTIISYRVVSAGTYDFGPVQDEFGPYGGVLAGFDLGTGWIGGGYLSVDGDDATYTQIAGANVIRIWLGDAFGIARVRLLIGTQTAGAKTYVLKGANEADFSDAVTVATLNFTATGSFTPDEVSDSWEVTDAYEFWELTGDDETRYVYSFELYQANFVVDISGVQADIDDHIADTTDAHDASAVSVLDTAGWYAGTNVETAMAELGAKVVGYQAHGNLGSTETFDSAIGWHSGTLDANCTLTLTGATSGVAASMILELAQDGTGGWDITLPSSVANKTDLEADQDTTLSTTSFLILMTRDGGTTWYGFWAGGSGSGVTYGTPAIVLGTAAAAGSIDEAIRRDSTIIAFDATDPTTLDYDDVADPGAAAVAARRDHVHGMPSASSGGGIGPLLLASDHSVPIIFDDILQASDGADFLYASEP